MTTHSTELLRFASGLAKALRMAGATHTLADVAQMLDEERAQIWALDNTCVITEILDLPQKRVLNFWLATGNKEEVFMLAPRICEWGKSVGCEFAMANGRRGWARTNLPDGWRPIMTTLFKEL